MKIGDIVLAVVLAVAGAVSAAGLHQMTEVDRPIDAFGLVLAAGVGLVLAVRRVHPVATLAANTVLLTVYLWLAYPYGPVMFTFVVAVYTVGRYLQLRPAVVTTAAAIPVLASHLLVNPASASGTYGLIPVSAFALVPLAIGVLVRVNRESVERARAEMIRERVSDERLRVAQEVHDVVGHGLAAIKMQADIALHLMARKPDQAEIALRAISQTSEEALDELRATLTVVRGRAPAPGLSLLPDLADRMNHAGVEVNLDVVGTQRSLPAAVDLAGYRVVQESLTNVLKHGPVKRASVSVAYEDGAVHVAVTNPAEADVVGDGFGIPGMRERVTSLGGQFRAGPNGNGLFEVRARLPTAPNSLGEDA
ncbi:sensor histidine kinase [Kibdelosporangium phytohabitans]|uniref:histidine kinase n=1 Tax=Kibdelosporangium phytohabitans TaxID=860235 RepID=A0A0N9HVN6_9PSEU|nr:histidine kinase [Kibdelosporangium phytohabitans]ALG11411.1 histidine kinase [Kibdelosporangium phytohabitans]MBE1462742.1 signal transduction histidine kinase [Kibdelosporangium phytohabitans]